MCHYIKNDGEECGRSADPFCHQHEDTAQAELWRLGVHPEQKSDTEYVEELESAFTQQTVEHTCDDCEAPVRRCVRLIEQSDYSREMADVVEGLTCQCGHFVQHDRTGGRIEKSAIPDAWL